MSPEGGAPGKAVPELAFATRALFRAWLGCHASAGGGVWLVFGKSGALATLSAAEALEEALCFGWIDGRMRRVDGARYLKYFSRRRDRSPWSDRNKKIVASLRARGLMDPRGEEAVAAARKNGQWDARREPVTDADAAALARRLEAWPPALAAFGRLPPSARRTLARRHLSFRTEEARTRDLGRMAAELGRAPPAARPRA